MDASCLAYGFVVSLAVSALKRIPFVKANPKTVAAVLAAIVAIAETMIATPGAGSVQGAALEILACIGAQFAAAVATYETITETLRDGEGHGHG